MITQETPSRDGLRSLTELDKSLAAENEIKSQIDASVWGVFLDQPAEGLRKQGYARFKVGGVSKGEPGDIIKLVSSRHDVKLGTEIHYVNLRKIDADRWTDVGVSQHKLNWGPEICEMSPQSPRCKIHRIEQNRIKNHCQVFIREIYYGCLSSNAIPNMCWQYKDGAFDE